MAVVALMAALTACGGADDEAVQDPVIRDVVQQLHAGASVDAIEAWLGRTDARPGAIGPAEKRALEQAGAPPHLIESLRERGGPGAVGLPPGLPATLEPTPQALATQPPELPDQPQRTQMVPPGPEGGALAAGAPLQLTVRTRDLDHDVVVALDGLPVLRAPAFGRNPVTTAPQVGRGRHALRAFILPAGASSLSGARVLDAPHVFDLAAGQEWIVGLEVSPDGAAWTANRSGEAGATTPAGTPASATHLCPAGRAAEAGCRDWNDLWSTLAGAPDQSEADAALRRLDLTPAPGS